jgi:hypothetical protein
MVAVLQPLDPLMMETLTSKSISSTCAQPPDQSTIGSCAQISGYTPERGAPTSRSIIDK